MSKILLKTILKLRNEAREILSKKNYVKTEFPECLNIELTIRCNANCIICPHKNIVRQRDMDFTLFKKIIDEASKHDIKRILPMLYGEPFMYPYFIEALEYIRKKMPSCKISMFTNGSISNEQLKKVIKDNLVDEIIFSLDAVRPETYKIVRGLNYETIVNNVLKFIQLNKECKNKIKTTVSFVIGERNLYELKEFKKFWKDKVSIHLGTDDGRINKPFINKSSEKPCQTIFNSMFILTNGETILCCIDSGGTLSIGNVKEKSLENIWNSEKYEYIRKLHLEGLKNKLPLCNNCSVRY